MAAEVSSLIRVMGGGYKEEQHRTVGNESHGEKSTALITRDLLGGSSIESQELDLDLQVPNGWEKRLDLQSGRVYLQKCNTTTIGSPPMSEHKLNAKPAGPKLQDLNFPSSSNVLLNLFDESSLDLKLVSSSLPSSNYQSVCTLDKVKSALERAEKEPIIRKRNSFLKSTISASSPSYSSSSSSIRETTQEEESEEKLVSSPMAAGCPGCLSYVMIMKNNPKCPRCNSLVPIPSMKKPRIDLNISI
ncbi:unnamed protein product [Sphenostylis stenocarpa]|uniref:GIR1-like zinc ribbon domain-containing protein n=1 Tax=Sphenostylis stenocarpa TaxID=92480 RepID=A0AA86SGU0_9FABA|nr:unnamed protein product [Sphenostylis stenocarpa]